MSYWRGMQNGFSKVVAGFLIGAVSVGGFAVANNNNVPVVKACIDNKTKAPVSYTHLRAHET